MQARPKVLALDAMGVIYRSADDVAELLIPFLRAKGSAVATGDIEDAYREASLGRLSSDQLWEACGVNAGLDEEYCTLHALTNGILELIADAVDQGLLVAALTNDVDSWSRRIRARFELSQVSVWVVSGEIGVRKPDRGAYDRLLDVLACSAADVLFLDDRQRNVDAAKEVWYRRTPLRRRRPCAATAWAWLITAITRPTAERTVMPHPVRSAASPVGPNQAVTAGPLRLDIATGMPCAAGEGWDDHRDGHRGAGSGRNRAQRPSAQV